MPKENREQRINGALLELMKCAAGAEYKHEGLHSVYIYLYDNKDVLYAKIPCDTWLGRFAAEYFGLWEEENSVIDTARSEWIPTEGE